MVYFLKTLRFVRWIRSKEIPGQLKGYCRSFLLYLADNHPEFKEPSDIEEEEDLDEDDEDDGESEEDERLSYNGVNGATQDYNDQGSDAEDEDDDEDEDTEAAPVVRGKKRKYDNEDLLQ